MVLAVHVVWVWWLWCASVRVVCAVPCPFPAPAPTCPRKYGCYISEGAGHGITFGLLIIFSLVGCLSVLYIKKMVAEKGDSAADFWYSARNSQKWWSIALSICATSSGAWLLYTPAEAAYYVGWWGVFGYTFAMFLGPLVMALLAGKIREDLTDSANITDWVKQRFGREMQVFVTIVLVYYMFIYLVSQLKTMGDMVMMFYGKDPAFGIVPVAIFTMLYTMVGGLPASIITDWIQAGAILLFVAIIFITIWTQVKFQWEDWEKANTGSKAGWDAFVAMCISIFGAEVFNLAFWQRVYAAEDAKAVQKGFYVGAGLVSCITFFFGACGLLLKANDARQNELCPPEGSPIVVPAFTFFEILDMPSTVGFTRGLVFVLAVCTITSCADSFQTAITSVISREITQYQLEPTKAFALGVIVLVIVNIPAMIFAIYAAKDDGADGLAVKLTDLFGMADIFTICLVVPLFSGLGLFVTTNGSAAGIFMGIFYILVWGWAEFGTFLAGFANLTMMCWGVDAKPQGYSPVACGPWYAWRSAFLFSTIPIVTFVVTYGVSWMENMYVTLKKYEMMKFSEEEETNELEEPTKEHEEALKTALNLEDNPNLDDEVELDTDNQPQFQVQMNFDV